MTGIPRGPAYRIETDRLILRCYEPADAAAVKAAVDASLGELRPWIPWARDEPQTLDEKVDLLRGFRSRFDGGGDRVYAVLLREGGAFVGACGLHDRVGDGAREIGYWIATPSTGRGFATEASAGVLRAAFEVDDLERVELHCEPENAAGVAVARKLGFRHDGTLRARFENHEGPRKPRMIWSMLREEFASSPAASFRAAAFDAIGRPLETSEPDGGKRARSAFR